ncbi:MAG TPA: hypothetical protein VGK67_38510 [Myxococcales bacterium]|jgi:hypothetical protein
MNIERKTITIPLDIPIGPDAPSQVEEAVQREMSKLARDGWTPDQPVNFESLKASGTMSEVGALSTPHEREFYSVDVRVKREQPES